MRAAFGLLIALCCCDAVAQRIVMYRCTDKSGAVTLQNDAACPKGSKQEKRVIETPAASIAPASAATAPSASTTPAVAPPMPQAATMPPTAAAPAAASAPTSAPPTPATPIARTANVPPPPLYRCMNLKREAYFSDTDLQPRRCVPMQAVGLDGNPNTGAGAVCEMVRDPCQAVAEQQACEGWRLRAEEARATARFGTGEQAANAKAALEKSEKVLRESCATP